MLRSVNCNKAGENHGRPMPRYAPKELCNVTDLEYGNLLGEGRDVKPEEGVEAEEWTCR